MRTLYTRYKSSGLVIIGQHIGDDSYTSSLDNLKNEIIGLEVNYAISQDLSHDNFYTLNTRAIPMYFLIDREGQLRYTQVGGGNPALEQNIIELLNEPASN